MGSRATSGVIRAPREHGERIPLLSGLRGLAAIVVFTSHAAIIGFLPEELGHGFGQLGVMLFFVLSGYLMAHIYLKSTISRGELISYSLARIGRVVPLYFAVIVVSAIIFDFVYPEFRYAISFRNAQVFLSAVTFVSAPFELWTIPVEIQFYAIFPIFWYLYSRGWRFKLIAVAGLFLAPTAITIVLFREKYTFFSTYGHAFFSGAAISMIVDPIKQRLTRSIPPWLGIAFLALFLINLPFVRMKYGLSLSHGEYWISTWLDPLTWITIFGLFICSVCGSPSLNILNTDIFRFLGKVSYGFYLFHYPILLAFADLMGTGLAPLALSTAVTVLMASLSFRYFEVPAMSWIRKYR